jgi:hypothetical protein
MGLSEAIRWRLAGWVIFVAWQTIAGVYVAAGLGWLALIPSGMAIAWLVMTYIATSAWSDDA